MIAHHMFIGMMVKGSVLRSSVVIFACVLVLAGVFAAFHSTPGKVGDSPHRAEAADAGIAVQHQGNHFHEFGPEHLGEFCSVTICGSLAMAFLGSGSPWRRPSSRSTYLAADPIARSIDLADDPPVPRHAT